MTDRELLAALYEQQGRILAHAGTTARKLDDVANATNGLARSVGAIEARLSAQDQRCIDHHRRTVQIEEWRRVQDQSVSDTQRNDAALARAQVAKIEADAAAARRRKWTFAASVVGGLIVAGGGTLITLAVNGCF